MVNGSATRYSGTNPDLGCAGELLGEGFVLAPRVNPGSLYPTVGLHSASETCMLNFGQRPFVYDIQAHLTTLWQERQRQVRLYMHIYTFVYDI